MDTRWIKTFTAEVDKFGSVDRSAGSGRTPRSARTVENVDAVNGLVRSQEDQPPGLPWVWGFPWVWVWGLKFDYVAKGRFPLIPGV